jgi:hypothetical protein
VVRSVVAMAFLPAGRVGGQLGAIMKN